MEAQPVGIKPLLALFGETDVEFFDDYEKTEMDGLCPVCGEILDMFGNCPEGCEIDEPTDEEDDYEDDLEDVGPLGQIETDEEV